MRTPAASAPRSVPWAWAGLAAVGYAAVTVALTWPVFRHPATTVLDTPSLYGPASTLIQRDINLTIWVLAWGARALVTSPLDLFHANAFYPAPYSLALSEHMLGNQPLFAPVYWVTGQAVLAHQATLLATFVLAGLAMAAYVLYWTGDRTAAVVGGLFYALAPFRLWQLGSLHVISLQYLPLIALTIDATLDRRGGTAGPVGLGVALLLSSLCSFYVGYAAFTLVAVYAAAGLAARGRGALGRLPVLAATAAGAGLVVAALSIPYVRLQRSGVLPDYGQVAFTSLAFLGMLKVGLGGLLRFYVVPVREGIPQYLCWTALALAVVGVARRRGHPRGALLATAVTGVVLSLGPYLFTPWAVLTLPYEWLARVVPGFSAMRVPQRFGALATLGVMALAGLGLAELRAVLVRRGRRAAAVLVPALAAALLLVEVRPGALGARPMPVGATVPPAYRWLAGHGEGGTLLELPANVNDLYRQSVYLYASTVHWLPLVNGYTPYPPRSFVDVMTAAAELPKPEALDAILGRVRLRWVLLHPEYLLPGALPKWEATLGAKLKRVADFSGAILYEVPAPPSAALAPREGSV